MKGEFISIETAEELAKLRKENEKLENDKRSMLLELYKTNDKIDKAIEYINEYQEVLKKHNGDWINYKDGFKSHLLNILQGKSDK